MGKQFPENETTRLVISEVAENDEESASIFKKHPPYYDSLPPVLLPLVVVDDDNSERSDDTSLLSRGWIEYNLHLDQWPVVVKSITAFVVLSLGDVFAQGGQHFAGGGTEAAAANGWDYLRSLRFGIFGLIGAPWSHYYYHLLDSALPPTESPWSWITFFKVFIDQFIQAPIALFFIILGLDLMEGLGIAGVEQDLQVHYWETLLANWKLWLPASVINIAFVEPRHRVLFVNVVFFLWIIVLSVMLNP